MKHLARLGIGALHAPVVRKTLFRPLLRDSAAIFMLHRFTDPAHGVRGHDPDQLRRALELLRDNGNPLLSLSRIVEHLRTGEPLPAGSVTFTVDDGYYDFYQRGLPVFEEYDCPVTAFLPTDFLDSKSWLWWDRIAAIMDAIPPARTAITLSATERRYHWSSGPGRSAAADRMISDLHEVPDDLRRSALRELEERTSVTLPDTPPARFASMTWNQVRNAAERGATFAPHTVTHPVLSRVNDEEARQQIGGSWRRLRQETRAAVPCLGYPNGAPGTFGDREARIAREIGLQAAVTTIPGYIHSGTEGGSCSDRYRLPRFAFPEDRLGMVQVASGFTRIKRWIRGVA